MNTLLILSILLILVVSHDFSPLPYRRCVVVRTSPVTPAWVTSLDLIHRVKLEDSLSSYLYQFSYFLLLFPGFYQFNFGCESTGRSLRAVCLTFSEVALPAPVAPLVNNSPANPLPPTTHLDLAQAHP